jgi:hypothetical protein
LKFPTRTRMLAYLIAILVPFVSLLRGWSLKPAHGPVRPAPDMAFIELELLYGRAADQLAPNLGNLTIAAGDVGVLGYYTNAHILDLVGINSPETLRYYPLDESLYGDFIYAVSPDLIVAELPEYLVILEIYGRYGLLKDERFVEAYELIQTLPTDIYGSDGMLIYSLK